MLDRETANLCTDALSSAIAALSEQHAAQAASRPPKRMSAVRHAETLVALSADIETLSEALAVIARRTEK